MLATVAVLFCSIIVSVLGCRDGFRSDSCILLKGPCGGAPTTPSPLSVIGGSNLTVIFQKNLNHFNKASPGYWLVSMAKSDNASFTEVYRVADSSVPSLTLYTATITLPNIAQGNKPVPFVIQTRYFTNNPKAPANFYQCSDIVVRKAD